LVKASAFFRALAGLVGMGAGAGLAFWLVLWINLRSSAVRAPDVRGLESARAVALVQEAGLVGRVQDGVFDANVIAGHVASQHPAPGFELKRGGTVMLYPSLGQAVQRVANVTGLPDSLAEAELEAAHLTLARRCEVEGEADGAVVVAQTPVAGTLVAPGSGVTVLVNRAPRARRFVMPEFVGTHEADATRVIRALGFQLAAVQRVPYPGIPADTVLRQDPGAGGPVAEGAVVAIWVGR
jgi:beta-lactam-binding protein with PASTA domain